MSNQSFNEDVYRLWAKANPISARKAAEPGAEAGYPELQPFHQLAYDMWRSDNPVCASAVWPSSLSWESLGPVTQDEYIKRADQLTKQEARAKGGQVSMHHGERQVDAANPKDGIGAKKVGVNFLSGKVIMDLADAFGSLSLVPQQPLFEMALAFVEGSYKYGAHNYRASGVRASIYYAAFNRHMTQWFTKQSDIDVDSGIHHTAKAMACIAIIMDSKDMGNWVDDRPIRLPIQYALSDGAELTASSLHDRAKECMILWWEGGDDKYLLEALRLLLVLRNEILTGKIEDDRIEQPFEIEAMNAQVKAIALKYPNPVPGYTELEWRDKL